MLPSSKGVALAIDKLLFRQIAGSFASGVTVIATGRDGDYHGMTASSFASLSLEPPLVLVCVDRAAATLPFLQRTGAFSVNILADSQAEISRQFAAKDSPQAHGLEGVGYRLGEGGVPVIEDCLAYFECRVGQQYDGGDHIIFVGEVIGGGLGAAAEHLLYYRGAYRTLGQ